MHFHIQIGNEAPLHSPNALDMGRGYLRRSWPPRKGRGQPRQTSERPLWEPGILLMRPSDLDFPSLTLFSRQKSLVTVKSILPCTAGISINLQVNEYRRCSTCVFRTQYVFRADVMREGELPAMAVMAIVAMHHTMRAEMLQLLKCGHVANQRLSPHYF